MGFILDILKDIPVNAVLRDKLQQKEREYEELEAENNKLRNENQRLKSKVKELTSSDELCENEVNILKLLSSIGRKTTAETIAGELGLSLIKTKYCLDKMNRQYVFSHDYSGGKLSVYYLNQKGRAYLVEHDLVK